MHAFAATSAILLLSVTVAAQKPAPPLKNAAAVPARQLTLRIGTVDPAATPGKPVDLVAEFTLPPRMHVYAPGQADYIPISLALAESPDYTSEPVVYPAAQSLYLEPIKQTAKVYEKTFRITQRVTVALVPELKRRAAAGDTLAIPATLKYQACDDAVCYRPETVKLTWTIKLASGPR